MREIKFRARKINHMGLGEWTYGTYANGCFYPDSHRTHRMFLKVAKLILILLANIQVLKTRTVKRYMKEI
jgi:hypothetical protein